jgi:putative peptidyl-prolyl cis-trans isomerase
MDNIMKKIRRAALSLILILTLSPAYTWEIYDQVIAVVNSQCIIESEVNNKLSYLQKSKNIPQKKIPFEKSRVLDKFIEDALVYEAASDEAIVISDARVVDYMKRMMKDFFITKIKNAEELDEMLPKLAARLEKIRKDKNISEDVSLDPYIHRFISFIESTQKIAFDDFFEEIRIQMRREQVMSIAIGVTPPSQEECKKWYKLNKNKLGYEINLKHILIRPVNNSLTKEKEANQKLVEIRSRIMAGEQFEKLAALNSHDMDTAQKGGDMGWSLMVELDPYFAGYVDRMRKPGEVSEVFKSGLGYHVVKYLGKRPVTFDKVERLIMFKLYNEKIFTQFQKWVQKKKNESDIQIYMKDYVKGGA